MKIWQFLKQVFSTSKPEIPDQEENWKEAERLAREFDHELADLKAQLVYLLCLLYKLEEQGKEE